MLGFQEDQSFLHIIATSIHIHCTWLAESINIWVEGMAVREGLSALSGLICEVIIIYLLSLYSVGQGNLHLSGKSQGSIKEFQIPRDVATMGTIENMQWSFG